MKFDVTIEHDRRPSPVKMTAKVEVTGIPEQRGEEMFQTKHRLSLTVYTEFWSNKAQLSHKVRQAEKMARAYLFREMLPVVEEIALESDSSEVEKLASTLKRMMLGA